MTAKGMQNRSSSIQLILARMLMEFRGKLWALENIEDLAARGMQDSSIQVILARMLRELRGKLWALENMKT